MKKEQFHIILQRHAISSGINLIGRGFIFQQDNDPKHTSKLCTSYMERKKVADATSIPRFKSHRAIIGRNELTCIPPQTLQKLTERMPKLCAAVIKGKGGHFQENRLK